MLCIILPVVRTRLARNNERRKALVTYHRAQDAKVIRGSLLERSRRQDFTRPYLWYHL
jgi:hypothetical protein